MSEPVVFRNADFDNLELVRQIVLSRLKQDSNWSQIDYSWSRNAEAYVRFEQTQLRNRFIVLANEIIWQLIIQGVITPGLDASNPNLPFFHITDYGKQVLESGKFAPHDPSGYLVDLRSAAKTTLGEVAITYVEEALRCFNAGCHMASVLLLGVAAESVFLEFCGIIEPALKDSKDQKEFSKLPDQVRPKHRWIINKYSRLSGEIRRNSLPESLDVTLISLYELIRRQRNDLGHPQETPPAIDREQAFVFFRLFPSYVRDVEAFAEYCKAKGL